MNYFLLPKREPNIRSTKSLNQYPNIKAHASGEIQPLESYDNTNVVFDDMFLLKHERCIDRLFTRGRHKNINIYYISQKFS